MTLLYILIAIGMLLTLAVVLLGVANMRHEGIEARHKSNKPMQLRVMAQVGTLLVLFLIFVVAASN